MERFRRALHLPPNPSEIHRCAGLARQRARAAGTLGDLGPASALTPEFENGDGSPDASGGP